MDLCDGEKRADMHNALFFFFGNWLTDWLSERMCAAQLSSYAGGIYCRLFFSHFFHFLIVQNTHRCDDDGDGRNLKLWIYFVYFMRKWWMPYNRIQRFYIDNDERTTV